MKGRLDGKVALVTGGSTGVGLGIASVFAQEGAKVAICSRTKDELEKTVHELSKKYDHIMGYTCDLTRNQEVEELIQNVVGYFGKLDILVNNVGKNPSRPSTIEDLTEIEWDEFFAANVKSSWLASKFAIPEMRKAGGGAIIMISSISAHRGQKNHGIYNCTKAAQEGLVKSMAVDFAEDKIRVNAICPAWVMTDRTRGDREKRIDEISKLHPLNKLGKPEDIGWAATYLASDEANWVTGASFAIDGGYMAW